MISLLQYLLYHIIHIICWKALPGSESLTKSAFFFVGMMEDI